MVLESIMGDEPGRTNGLTRNYNLIYKLNLIDKIIITMRRTIVFELFGDGPI